MGARVQLEYVRMELDLAKARAVGHDDQLRTVRSELEAATARVASQEDLLRCASAERETLHGRLAEQIAKCARVEAAAVQFEARLAVAVEEEGRCVTASDCAVQERDRAVEGLLDGKARLDQLEAFVAQLGQRVLEEERKGGEEERRCVGGAVSTPQASFVGEGGGTAGGGSAELKDGLVRCIALQNPLPAALMRIAAVKSCVLPT